jgi:hypothetical protein
MTADTFEFRKNGADSALIFLHGFTGDLRKTWGEFPMLLMGAGELNDWDIFSVGYVSTLFIPDQKGLWKAAPDIQKLADTLVTRLEYGFDRYRRIAFAAHSMGGLIVQRALLDSEAVRRRISHVFLFGTPSNGLLKAVIAAKLVGKRQVRDMQEGCPFIIRLRRDWEKEFGYDNFPFHFQSVAGDEDEFVPATSAHGNFPRAHCQSIPGGHLEIAKPTSPGHLAVRIVAKGLRERRNPAKERPQSADEIDPHQQLPRECAEELLRFLSQYPPEPDAVASACRASVSVPERIDRRLPDPDGAPWWRIARKLLEFPTSPGFHPLVPFLRNLGKNMKLKPKESRAFSQTAEAIAKHLGHPIPPSAEKRPCHLLIDLKIKSHSGPRAFSATIHEWRGSEVSGEGKPPAFSGRESEIGESVARFLEGYDPDDQPEGVEVFLPAGWLTAVRPERWTRSEGPGFPEAMGILYPTAVRLNRRETGVPGKWIERWQSRWHTFREENEGSPGLHARACWIGESECGDPAGLCRKLNRTDARPLLVAPFLPPEPAKDGRGWGLALLQAGIPAALWGKAEPAEIATLLNRDADLPRSLHDHRRDHEESGLSLMWDDPERLPPWMSYETSGQLLEGPTEKTP